MVKYNKFIIREGFCGEIKNKKSKAVRAIKNDNPNIIFFHLCVLIFVLGCLIGYFVEVYYAFLKHGRYINEQGMIYDPFNQIYGFGALIFVLLLYKIRNANKFIIFLAGAFVGGAFKYVCSLIQEVVFKSESWNYSKIPFSFNGRTNPIHAAFWGILGGLFFWFVFPVFIKIVSRIKPKILKTLSWCLIVFMILNMTISAAAVIRQVDRKAGNTADNAIERFLDKQYTDEFLKKVYPNMKFK